MGIGVAPSTWNYQTGQRTLQVRVPLLQDEPPPAGDLAALLAQAVAAPAGAAEVRVPPYPYRYQLQALPVDSRTFHGLAQIARQRRVEVGVVAGLVIAAALGRSILPAAGRLATPAEEALRPRLLRPPTRRSRI